MLCNDGRALLVRARTKQVAADRVPPTAVDVKPEGIVAEIVPCREKNSENGPFLETMPCVCPEPIFEVYRFSQEN